MWLDLSPLRKYPAFRNLYFGQLVSILGTSLSFVALPYDVYQKTGSTKSVGLIGVIQLVPLVLTSFWGGALADSSNRVRLIIGCELALAFGYALYPALTQGPSPVPCYILAGIFAALSGIHRPALDSLSPRLVPPEDISKIGALHGFRGTLAHVIGPTIGGLLVAQLGVGGAFWIDSATYLLSVLFLLRVPEPKRAEKTERPSLSGIVFGLKYALSRPVLLGTYLVDVAAMMFCYPLALYPALAQEWASSGAGGGDARVLGWLYSSTALGALISSVMSRWTIGVRRYGAMITLSAIFWCAGIAVAGFSGTLLVALGCFVFAGYADMVSGIFRANLWNETIPDSVRGRLAGIEMLSYMSGPLIGNTWMGFLAASQGTHRALQIGGGISMILIIVMVAFVFPALWKFRSAVERDAVPLGDFPHQEPERIESYPQARE